MHRLIMSPPDDMQVIHLNGDLLDHRRANLRTVTHAQAMQRQKQRALSSSRYKGVQLHKKTGLWRATIHPEGRLVHLGYFEEEVDAARAYDEAALHHYGPDAWTNFSYAPGAAPTGYIVQRRSQTTRYRGVTLRPEYGKWRVVLCCNGRRINVGEYATELEAALAYDKAAIENLGTKARLNFPEMQTDSA